MMPTLEIVSYPFRGTPFAHTVYETRNGARLPVGGGATYAKAVADRDVRQLEINKQVLDAKGVG